MSKLIAEIGQNHMGNEQYAKYLLHSLIKNKDIDAITFQIREKNFYSGLRKKLILNDNFYYNAKNKIKRSKKKFGVALCDPEKIEFFENIGVDFVKVINNDIKNDFLVKKLLKSKIKKIYFSTGLSDEKDIKELLKKIKKTKKEYEIIHTTLSNDVISANLNSIRYLKTITNIPIAFGLHSEKWEVLLLSLCYNPASILFYVKGSKFKIHRDEKHALPIKNLNRITNIMKIYPKIIGDFNKKKPKKTLDYK